MECLPSQSRWQRCHLRARPGCGAREAFGLLELAWSQRKAELSQSGAEAWEWSACRGCQERQRGPHPSLPLLQSLAPAQGPRGASGPGWEAREPGRHRDPQHALGGAAKRGGQGCVRVPACHHGPPLPPPKGPPACATHPPIPEAVLFLASQFFTLLPQPSSKQLQAFLPFL